MNAITPAPIVEQPSIPLTPLAMIDRAIERGATPEMLGKLLDLQERFEANEARKAFDEAVAAAKAEIKPITKNKTVSFESKNGGASTNYSHEDFAQVSREVDPILTKYGLSYRYSSKQDAKTVSVTCILSHRMGHREETTLSSGEDHTGNKNAIQAIGSSVTYLQRYTLKLALGLAAAPDTDGRAALIEGSNTITADEYQFIADLLEKTGADEKKVLSAVKAESLETMTQKQYREATARLQAWAKAQKEKVV